MTPRSIQYVLRSLADTGPPVPDAELLRRFAENDEKAFAEIIRRHGRLVWAVCRHLTNADSEADDAFQATFLVLLKNAKKVRDAGKLSAWLHGVAYKVCAKARQAAQRRNAREQATAQREGNGSAVPDSAWDRALAAVHEEVAKLPETLRVPFVLCCLEGIGVTEAAEQLGWKLGTLSGRLTRAKDAVLAKLEARGMSLGVVASVGIVSVPAAVSAKAESLAQVGYAVPNSILQLSQGVFAMNVKTVKVLAVAVMLACGLSLSVGTGWVANAEAQSAGGPPPAKADEVKRLEAELALAKAQAELAAKVQDPKPPARAQESPAVKTREAIATFKTDRTEYDFVIATEMNMNTFANFLSDRDARGWDYCGTTALTDPKQSILVFRRAVPAPVSPLSKYGLLADYYKASDGKPGDAQALEAEIARLQEKLKEMKKKLNPGRVLFAKDALPLDTADFAELLAKMGEKKFGKGRVTVTSTPMVITVEGDKEITDWATELVKSLSGVKK